MKNNYTKEEKALRRKILLEVNGVDINDLSLDGERFSDDPAIRKKEFNRRFEIERRKLDNNSLQKEE
ncbi:MAG: hypothetical protein ACFCUI_04980 [Bernardetiaceae bacterium]